MSDRYFENLQVWQDSRKFVNEIYDIMLPCRDYGFRDQIQRAAVSIMNNIAEGQESGSDAKFVNFINISRGSCSEVRSMLYLCKDRHFCTNDQFDSLMNKSMLISKKLYNLKKSIENSNYKKEHDLSF